MSVDIRPTPPAQDSARQNVTLQIVSVVMFTFIGYLTIGIPLAVLPGYVHDDLGYGSVLAGLVISLQYLATLLARPYAGRVIDGLGPKRAVLYGMAGSAASGLFMLLSVAIQGWPALSLASLLVGRLVLGAAESLVGSAAIGWAIGRVGAPHTAKVISWNGIASYGAIALGAPLGVLLVHWLGLWSMGASIVLLGALGFALAWPKLPAPLVHGERLPFHHVLGRVTPHGMGLALGAIGFGTIATFITLYYASRGWANAVLCLSAFGGCFIGARLLFANSINRLGGFRVAIICSRRKPRPAVAVERAESLGRPGRRGPHRLRLLPGVPGVRRGSGEPGTGFQPWRGAGRLLAVRRPVAGHHRALVGFVANLFGFRSMFLFACLASLGGLALAVALHRRSRRPG